MSLLEYEIDSILLPNGSVMIEIHRQRNNLPLHPLLYRQLRSHVL